MALFESAIVKFIPQYLKVKKEYIVGVNIDSPNENPYKLVHISENIFIKNLRILLAENDYVTKMWMAYQTIKENDIPDLEEFSKVLSDIIEEGSVEAHVIDANGNAKLVYEIKNNKVVEQLYLPQMVNQQIIK